MSIARIIVIPWLALCCLLRLEVHPGPVFLEDRFEMPPGFRIYKAAGPELTGGSYDIVFDGRGRLLVGDGNAVRRLEDKNGDGVFDLHEVIATGLGWRGPQGMIVLDDKLYAVGGDGIQVYEGYNDGGPLRHTGRLGEKFNTGGDHDGHTLLRGFDGFIYFMAGNGSGLEGRKDITRSNSPVLLEREACIFRFDPLGKDWECIASGGRNPPSLGLNYLGDFFSYDSDMEWHVGLPIYRPVRLNHWIIGGDQGWHEVGASPNYFIDALGSVMDNGRGSPNWGVFYEHEQLPEQYRNAFLVCDYRWKSATTDEYASTGRLVSFFLDPEGGSYKAKVETLARPKPRATDSEGKHIGFGLVDIEVAPDGSLFLSDHNQGIWRIVYDPHKKLLNAPIRPYEAKVSQDKLNLLLTLPQPVSEWSRLEEEKIKKSFGANWMEPLGTVALDRQRSLKERLRAIRLLGPKFEALPSTLVEALAMDGAPEVRGQAAWLIGIRERQEEIAILERLLGDNDGFVRRKAAESANRIESGHLNDPLITRLQDEDRNIRYCAMTALSKRKTREWLEKTAASDHPQVLLRALTAAHLRRERPSENEAREIILKVLSKTLDKENELDLMRVITLYEKEFSGGQGFREKIANRLLDTFPANDPTVRWEQVRLLGLLKVERAIPPLVRLLQNEKDPVTQFHIGQALAGIGGKWNKTDEEKFLDWIEGTQKGWFSEFEGKGVEFPMFLSALLSEAASHHETALLARMERIELPSLLGGTVLNLLLQKDRVGLKLIHLYNSRQDTGSRLKLAEILERAQSPEVGRFLELEFEKTSEPRLKTALLQALAAQTPDKKRTKIFLQALKSNDVQAIRASAEALSRTSPEANESLATLVIGQLEAQPQAFHSLERLLVKLSKKEPEGFDEKSDPARRPSDSYRERSVKFWTNWFQSRFGHPFLAPENLTVQKSDEEIRAFILRASFTEGHRLRGRRVYERLQCNTCHAGGETPGQEGRLFGPDLTGVTQRLSREELADAMVNPSKQVADRFKAHEIKLKNGESLTGFITEQSDERLTFATKDQVQIVPRNEIEEIRLQDISLMPQGLLNGQSWEEITDLLTFLATMGLPR